MFGASKNLRRADRARRRAKRFQILMRLLELLALAGKLQKGPGVAACEDGRSLDLLHLGQEVIDQLAVLLGVQLLADELPAISTARSTTRSEACLSFVRSIPISERGAA